MTQDTVQSNEKTVARTLLFELRTDDNSPAPVHLVGNFNNWNPNDSRFMMNPIGSGVYTLELPVSENMSEFIEYKYTRGGWQHVEVDRFGNAVGNRSAYVQQGKISDWVPRWKKHGMAHNPKYLPIISVISEHFEVPQLIKTRRIAALLPHDYYQSERRYPVLYLQDGQNLYDDYAPFGNWAVDKKMAILAEQGMGDLIVVAIDHAEEQRIAEFTPSMKTKLGRGEGKKYARFLADTLKPYIDKHFRTLPEREHTGIGGSSMGGLITIYAGLMYPEVFSKLMVFSPSLWVSPNIYGQVMVADEPLPIKMYLYGGEAESKYMIPSLKGFMTTIQQEDAMTNIEFHLSVDPHGKHHEARWGEEFPKAVEWLFFNQTAQKTHTR